MLSPILIHSSRIWLLSTLLFVSVIFPCFSSDGKAFTPTTTMPTSAMSTSITPTPIAPIKIVTEILPPYQIYNEQGQLDGYAIEVVKALLKAVNLELPIKVLPWSRAYNMALVGENVMIFSMTQSKERLHKFIWIGDLIDEKVCFWQKVNKKDNQQNFKKSIFSAPRFSISAQYLLEQQYPNVYLTSTAEQSFAMLYSERADYIFTTEDAVKKYTEKLGFDAKQISRVKKIPAYKRPLGIAFSKNSDKSVIKTFQQAFKQLKQKGILLRMKKQWQLDIEPENCY